MNYTKRRWVILTACCLINLCIGSLYAWSVFAGPLLEKLNGLGANLTSLSIVFTIANAVGPITMIGGGFINDRIGAKWVIFIGGIMFGLGMALSGRVSSLSMLIVTYGLLVGLGIGLVYGATVSNSVKFFPDKKGLAGGLTTAFYGMSSIIMPPIAVRLLNAAGITKGFLILGIIMGVIICVSAFFIDKCPDGFLPDGYVPPVTQKKGAGDKDWKGMLSSPVFYVMILMLLCGAFSGLMVTSSASAVSREMLSISAEQAAIVVSMVALFNTFGRIAAGSLSDKLGSVNTILISFVLALVGQLAVYISNGSVVLFYVGLALIGFCFGSLMGIYPGFTASQFGSKYNSVNYGIMFVGFALAGYFGPTIMSSLHTSTGEYKMAFLVAAGLSVAGLLLNFVFRAMQKKKA
ncbi:MAG: OFA family MFS transporter [Erysipelotrichaceae bacterium]|nr:OFA family MFS transporter [Erysipelotrichaceae bacterium]MBR4122261.1 OFA family MFS transporter [Erysipelotrichaceae bacterium]